MDFSVNIKEHCQTILQEVIDSEDYTDVTLITDDKVEIKANRLVLSIIPMFRNLFQTSDECDEQVILLELDSVIVHLLLELLYTGNLMGGENELFEVNEAFWEFGVNHLTLLSPQQQLEEQLDTEPAADHQPETEPEPQPLDTSVKPAKPKQKRRKRRFSTGKYECIECKQEFEKYYSLQNHYKRYCKKKNYKCTQCDYETLRSDNLKKHVSSIHSAGESNTEDTPEQSPNTKQKRRRRRDLNDLFPSLECPECHRMFKTKPSLVIHYRNKHENLKYECVECKQEFTQYSSLQNHRRSIHKKEKYKCTQCDYETSRSDNLKKHVSTIHFVGESTKRRPRLACYACHKTLADKTTLNAHIRTQHAELLHSVELDIKVLLCDQCDFKGSSEKSLKNHLKFAHEGVHFRNKHGGFEQNEETEHELQAKLKQLKEEYTQLPAVE